MPTGLSLQGALNAAAHTSGLGSQGAANVIAGTTGLSLDGALNVAAGTKGVELQGVLNKLAGTNGLAVQGAANAYAALRSATAPALTGSSTNGVVAANATTCTITVPTSVTGNTLLVILSRNQQETGAFTFDANVSSITEITNVDSRRVTALLVTLNGTPSTFTLTSVTTSLWTWWASAVTGVNAAASRAASVAIIGNSTSSAITPPVVDLGYIANGGQLAFAAANVNATATWTSTGTTAFASGGASNASLMVITGAVAPDSLAVTFPTMDRGNNGTSRNQNAIAFVLQGTPAGITNLVSNGSFETASGGIATGWADEHTTATLPTYSLTASGVVDGAFAQNIQYTGVSADAGTAKLEIYQSLIPASAGQTLTFSVYVSGTLTNTYCFIGIEGFLAGGTYIDETDANIVTVTSTPTKYTVSYLCKANTNYVAVYLQVPTIGATATVNLNLDKAKLTVG